MDRKARNLIPILVAVLALQGLPARATASAAPTPVPLKPKTVTASKGPFLLTFEVARTRVREEDPLWVRVTLANTGKVPRQVDAAPFQDALLLTEPGVIRVEVREAKSKDPLRREKRQDLILTAAVKDCLAAESKGQSPPPYARFVTLAPGAAVSTSSKPPARDFALRRCLGDPAPVLMAPYSELPGFDWTEKIYEARAVYDDALPPGMEAHLTEKGRKNRDAMVRFETPWVSITRIP